MVALTFPKSSTPGSVPGEGAGRLVNCYWSLDGDRPRLGPVPGLVPFGVVAAGPRGFLLVGSLLYVAVKDALYTVNAAGVATLVGILSGSDPVTMARNNRSPSPDVVIVSEDGPFIATGSGVSDYPDPDVNTPTSVAFLDGYFLFSYGDGTIRASGLNTTDLNDQSFTKAESKPDGLIRGIAKNGQYIALGPTSTEFYSNAGTQPFPLARAEVSDTGLFGRWAAAGFEDGWDRPWFSVASDRTVCRWDGYTPTRVSTREVERSIGSVTDPDSLRMCVYGFGGNAVVSLSGPDFTWEYHVTAGRWFERESYGADRWRGERSVNAFNRWLVGDLRSTSIMAVSETARREGPDPLVCTMEAIGPTFPQGARLNDMRVEITTGQGKAEGFDPIEADPTASISWSLDGGGTWGNPLPRSLGKQGEFGHTVRVSSLGRARGGGVRVRIEISDPVSFSLYANDVGRLGMRKG